MPLDFSKKARQPEKAMKMLFKVAQFAVVFSLAGFILLFWYFVAVSIAEFI